MLSIENKITTKINSKMSNVQLYLTEFQQNEKYSNVMKLLLS